MRSAVRWFEAARSGALGRSAHDVALRRCVLRSGPGAIDTSKLPAGLSAALQSRHPALSSWHVVPVKATPSKSLSERAVQDLADVGLRRRLIEAELQSSRSVDQAGSTSALHTILDNSRRSRITSQDISIKHVSGSSAASAQVQATVSSSAAPRLLAVIERAAGAEPLPRAVLNSEQRVTGRDASTASPPTKSRGPTILQRLIEDKRNGGPVLAPSSDVRSQRSSTEPPGSAVKTTDMPPADVSLGRELSSLGLGLSLRRSATSRPNVGSLIPPRIVGNHPPVAIVASVARVLSSGVLGEGHEVVPRKMNEPLRNAGGAQELGELAPAPTTAPRSYGSQYQTPSNRVPSYTDASATQGGQAGMMVTLRGDVLMDGRKMGRLVATGQTSAATLPTLSGSAINLRAMPIFAGTSAPL